MLVKGSLISEFSGKLAGVVGSHNRGGQYLRQWRVPTDPATGLQQAVRGAVQTLSIVWSTTLTPAQREAWDVYAELTPVPNRMGTPVNIGGLGHYIRTNVIRLQASLARIDDAPGTEGLTNMGNVIGVSENDAGDEFQLSANTNVPLGTTTRVYIYMSPGVSPARNFYKGPYRFVGSFLLSDTVTDFGFGPLPAANLPWPIPAVGSRVHYQFRIQIPDGRTSNPVRLSTIVEPI